MSAPRAPEPPHEERRDLDLSTITGADEPTRGVYRKVAGITVLAHPDLARVGDRMALLGLGGQTPIRLSRREPDFVDLSGETSGPLADRHLSRDPALTFVRDPRLRLLPAGPGFELDGERVSVPVEVSPARLRRGAVITLARRVALLLHEISHPLTVSPAELGLIGASASLAETREEISRVRDLDVPVLLRGETGTGKELVARAIHRTGRRAEGPFVAVNMAALPPSLAAAELFGSVRGAFTGADRPRAGLFRGAAGGTLFLDEIGAMPSEVQVLLLRFLEDHEVRSLGAQKGETVDVRVVAATDSDLDRAVESGSFSRPLLQRIGGYEIRLPPLRQRKGDLGLLLHHFLRQELQAMGKEALLVNPGPGATPWLPAAIFAPLVHHDWPGNIRELRNLALRLAVRYHDQEIELDAVQRLLSTTVSATAREHPGGAPTAARAPRSEFRDASEVSDEELEAALQRSRWDIKRAAADLGVARPTLYKRIEAHPSLSTAAGLSEEEIAAAYRACAGSLDRMVDRLKVSKPALKRRLRALGLT